MDPYRRIASERRSSHGCFERPSTSHPRSHRAPTSGLFAAEYDPFGASSSSRRRPSMGVGPSESSRYPSASASDLEGPSTRHMSSRDYLSYTGSAPSSHSLQFEVADIYPPIIRRDAVGGNTAGDYSGADPDRFYEALARRASRQRTSDGDPELPIYRSASDYQHRNSQHRAPSYGSPSYGYSDPQPPPYTIYSGPSEGYQGDRYPPSRRPSYWVPNPNDNLMDGDHFRRRRQVLNQPTKY